MSWLSALRKIDAGDDVVLVSGVLFVVCGCFVLATWLGLIVAGVALIVAFMFGGAE
jgi:hypothetical protein